VIFAYETKLNIKDEDDEDPGLRIESFAVINLRGVSTNKTIIKLNILKREQVTKIL
jgi:hypothetical protein